MLYFRKEVPAVKQVSTYPVKIRDVADIRKALSDTAGIYRKAVDFFIGVCMDEWDAVSAGASQVKKKSIVETFTVSTAKNKDARYDFGKGFYKFPSYLRRAAIAEAIGKVDSSPNMPAKEQERNEGGRIRCFLKKEKLWKVPCPYCSGSLIKNLQWESAAILISFTKAKNTR